LRLAVIGCGAVTTTYHLPALRLTGEFVPTAFVDLDLDCARRAAAQWPGVVVTADLEEAIANADAALVATPHSSHGAIAGACLRQGRHVLCEKPLAVTVDECDSLLQASEQSKAVLSVGLMRRCIGANQVVRSLLSARWAGEVVGFHFEEGERYNWPTTSGFFWKKETAGGGVLVDTGAHTLDLLTWWLGDWESVEYWDDSLGGLETNCELRVRLKELPGVEGTVQLSRTHELSNVLRIECSGGWIEVDARPPWALALHDRRSGVTARAVAELAERSLRSGEPVLPAVNQPFAAMWQQFARAVRGEPHGLATAAEARSSAGLMEACYARRQVLAQPWLPGAPGPREGA